jgi:hypothetical protein
LFEAVNAVQGRADRVARSRKRANPAASSPIFSLTVAESRSWMLPYRNNGRRKALIRVVHPKFTALALQRTGIVR